MTVLRHSGLESDPVLFDRLPPKCYRTVSQRDQACPTVRFHYVEILYFVRSFGPQSDSYTVNLVGSESPMRRPGCLSVDTTVVRCCISPKWSDGPTGCMRWTSSACCIRGPWIERCGYSACKEVFMVSDDHCSLRTRWPALCSQGSGQSWKQAMVVDISALY